MYIYLYVETQLIIVRMCFLSVGQSVIDSFRLEMAIASTELASLF